MTTIHHYDPETGAYHFSELAEPNPRRPAEPLVPAHATTVAPPAAGAGRIAAFRDGRWSLVPDLRGHRYWSADGAEHTVTALGPLPAGAVLEAPPSPAHRWDGTAWAVPPRWPSQAAAKRAVVAAVEAVEDSVVGLRSWGERQSWRDQEPAARAVLAGAPDHEGALVLDGIRGVTGEEREELAQLVVEAADLFRRLTGPLVGYRRAIHAAIDAAADLREVEEVTLDGLEQIEGFARTALAQSDSSNQIEGTPQ